MHAHCARRSGAKGQSCPAPRGRCDRTRTHRCGWRQPGVGPLRAGAPGRAGTGGKAFNQVNKRVQEKFIGEDLQQKAQIKKAISDTIVEEGIIEVEKVLDRAFEDGQEVKGIYREALKKANLDKAEIKVGEVMARKFDRQKIITGNGIEISIPVDYYQDTDKVEITANSDGTINIIVKNIDEYKSV